MPRTRQALIASLGIASIGAVLLLVGCSSANDSTPTTTTQRPATTTASPTTTTAGSTTTAGLPSGPGGVQIVKLTGPRSPVSCNAPTSVELHFETKHATAVTLRINGGEVFATYSNGAHDELVPLACDGSPQTYVFTARGANGTTATKSLTLHTSTLATS